MGITDLQKLRGLTTHWSSLFWRTRLRPIDGLLAHADETGQRAQCAAPALILAFWNMLTFRRQLAADDKIWPPLLGEIFGVWLEFINVSPVLKDGAILYG